MNSYSIEERGEIMDSFDANDKEKKLDYAQKVGELKYVIVAPDRRVSASERRKQSLTSASSRRQSVISLRRKSVVTRK